MPKPDYQQAQFLLSAPDLSVMPEDEGREVAFAGRSNAGKSSSLNVLAQQKRLARTSRTPGRTQQINVFGIAPGKRLIDLPGYGYAAVPAKVQARWMDVMGDYFARRVSLSGVVLLMDARRPLQAYDQQLIDWLLEAQLPVLLLLTKADKLNQSERSRVLKHVQTVAADWPDVSCLLFSAHRFLGLSETYDWLDQRLEL